MKRKKNYYSKQIQTKRNPRNKHVHEKAVAHANMLLLKKEIHAFNVNQQSKKYA